MEITPVWNFDRLVVATQNAGKLEQLVHALGPALGIPIIGLADLPRSFPTVEENGDTFAANALLKARFFCQELQEPVLADDSGLIVPVLGGRPGVYSARYAGEGASDQENRAKLLAELAEVKEEQARCATFVCALAFCAPQDGPCWTVHGICSGRITHQESGAGGFGYDSLFHYAPLQATFAAMAPEQRLAVGHRGQAVQSMRLHLQTRYTFP